MKQVIVSLPVKPCRKCSNGAVATRKQPLKNAGYYNSEIGVEEKTTTAKARAKATVSTASKQVVLLSNCSNAESTSKVVILWMHHSAAHNGKFSKL